jgi:GNAT superfamily N-acetyltransferase
VVWYVENLVNREVFERRVYQNWADHFGCSLEVIWQSGTILVPSEGYAASNGIHIWTIGKRSFVQMDHEYAEVVEQVLNNLPQGTALSTDDLQTAWGKEVIAERSTGLLYYLFPDDLPLFAPAEPFVVRQLTSDDAKAMEVLFEVCRPEEIDEAYVSVDHQIAFGCFAGDQLLAAGSGDERAGFMDLGVLTHPTYRGYGLGKAVVGAMCEWSIARDIIPQYRCDAKDLGSKSVAEGLNFRLYFRQESVWLR